MGDDISPITNKAVAWQLTPPETPSLLHGVQEQMRAEYRALYKGIGARILALCAVRGLTPEDLQREAKLSLEQTRGNFAWGPFECDFRLTALYRIAKALKVTVGKLLE